jgi:hypothetical protein
MFFPQTQVHEIREMRKEVGFGSSEQRRKTAFFGTMPNMQLGNIGIVQKQNQVISNVEGNKKVSIIWEERFITLIEK